MKKRVIRVTLGSGGSFKFETRADTFDRVREQAEALLEKDEIINSVEYLLFDVV